MASLEEYRKKRHFKETPEPGGKVGQRRGNRFVVQEHHARRLHYDFRLEVEGVLKSWAVPKGPSLNPADKRLAIQTEDHPLEYRTFQGTIPAGHYGAGEVGIWDSGTFEPEGQMGAAEQIERGELKFILHGKKLNGSFVLVRIRGRRNGDKDKKEWLLIKHRDAAADTSGPAGKVAEPMLAPREKKHKVDGHIRPDLGKRPEIPEGARKSAMPEIPQVALATLAENPSSDPGWIFEIKWDGIRTIARVGEGKVRLWSRTKREITSEFPELSTIAAAVNAKEVLLDGEVVVLDETGRSDFQRLQSRMGVRNPTAKLMSAARVVYYVFDILYCDGYDLRRVPLIERKEFLREIVGASAVMRYSDHQVGEGEKLFELARAQHLEGIIGKQASSVYPSGRTTAWLKFKMDKEVDAVVGGWTEPRGSREYFGALLLGLYDGAKLIFVGAIGSGFTVESQKTLWPRLQSLKTTHCPFAERPPTREKASWLKPELVARARFGGWTEGTHLRQPRFIGLQEDRDPHECTLEKEMKPPVDQERMEVKQEKRKATSGQWPKRDHSKASKRDARAEDSQTEKIEKALLDSAEEMFVEVDGKRLRFTNLNKVYFPEDKITKRDLLVYYNRVAPLLLPFLKDRPLVLRRYPNGIHGPSFFQKDADKNTPEWIQTVPITSEREGKPVHYFIANDRATLLYLTNLGCIDHNPWSSRIGSVENPDYVFFDLDPTPNTPFAKVMKLAEILLSILEKVQLSAFSKTSGATGFHIFVPVEPCYRFEQARAFVEAVASIVDAKHPGLLTAERSLRKRPEGRIYLDAHQNSSGQSLATVYTVRAFPHAPVSAPVRTEEVRTGLNPEKFNLTSMPKRIQAIGDLWADFWKQRQKIEPAAERLQHLKA